MKDVMKKRVVGAIVLVILGILLPLLLARWLHNGESDNSASMRVYEITPDGQARPADSDAGAVAGNGEPRQSTPRADIDGSTGVPEGRANTPPRPQTVSPAAQAENSDSHDSHTRSAAADDSAETPAAQGSSASDSGGTRQSSSAAPAASPAQSTPDSDDGDKSLRRTGSGGSGWVVQVASFGDENNAKRLASQLNGKYTAFYRAADVDGKTWYRVRLGPFDEESQARTLAAELRREGRSTLVKRAE